MGTSLKGKNSRPRSEFFPLRAVHYSMENHFYHTRLPPLYVTILLYANVLSSFRVVSIVISKAYCEGLDGGSGIHYSLKI